MDELPAGWLGPPHLDSVVEGLKGLPVLRAEKDSRRAAIAIAAKTGEIQWIARNFVAAGNFLVHLQMTWGGVDPNIADNYKQAILHLGSRSAWRLALTKFTYLLGSNCQLEELFTELVQLMGMKHHSLTVIDLFSGQGLVWHAEDGVTVEIEPARPASNS
jgi:hypothetical protein